MIENTFFPAPSEEVLGKVALYLHMQVEVRAGQRAPDPSADSSILDDQGVAGWLAAMKRHGFVRNDRYTRG